MGCPGALARSVVFAKNWKYGLSMYISQDHYYIVTRHNRLFSHYNQILRKNAPKGARKYKTERVHAPTPRAPIIFLKSNLFNMAAVSVNRSIKT